MAMPAFWSGVALFAVTPRRSEVAYSESISPNNQAALPTRENDLLEKTSFLKYFNVIWVVQSPSSKYSASQPTQISGYFTPSRSPKRDARDRHERRERDAMDAEVCETNAPTRTTKSRGPGAPTLALSSWSAQRALWGRRWQKSPVTEESAK
jgi:hypothetical protein